MESNPAGATRQSVLPAFNSYSLLLVEPSPQEIEDYTVECHAGGICLVPIAFFLFWLRSSHFTHYLAQCIKQSIQIFSTHFV